MISDNQQKLFNFKDATAYTVSLILAGIFLFLAFRGVDFNSLLEIIGSSDLLWIAIFIAFQMTAHYFRAVRWKVIFASLNPDVSTYKLFVSVISGYGFNNLIPRFGEVARAMFASKFSGISASSMVGTVVVERVLDIILFALAVLLAGFIYKGDLYESFGWLKTTLYIGTAGFVFLIIFLYLLIRFKEKFTSLIISIVSRFSEGFAHRLGEVFGKLTSGFGTLTGAKNYALVVFHSIMIMVFYGLSNYAGFYIIDMSSVKGLDLSAAWVVMSVSSIGVMIPTPGGIGSFHTICKSVLVSLYGVTPELGLAYATVIHGISYIIHTLMTVYYMFRYKELLSDFKTKFSTLFRGESA